MRYLLDTNICIFIIKENADKIVHKFKSCKPGDIAISSITVAEISYGVGKSLAQERNQLALDTFLTSLEIVDFDYRAATVYGVLRSKLEKSGTPIGPLDNLIAAQAMSLGLILVTSNTKEFRRIKELDIEDWSK